MLARFKIELKFGNKYRSGTPRAFATSIQLQNIKQIEAGPFGNIKKFSELNEN